MTPSVTDLCPLCRKRFDEPRAECPDDGTALIEDRTGQSLGGRYTIRELLGIGSRGVTVWEAWQEDAERRVAVKLLPLDDADRDHFLDASANASVLDHPNVVRLFDFNKTEDGLACGVMELIEGRPISVALSDGQAMPVDEALHIVQQVLDALAHAHENGVLHLDVKPGNVFIVPADDGAGPRVKLVDFGLVQPRPVTRRFAGPLASKEQPSESLHYTAPELLASGRAGAQSDLYSVGALLYRLMSGNPPFPFETATEIARGHLTHNPPSPFSIRPIGEMPSALPEILEQALDKAPARRFASAEAMRSAIDAAIRGETLFDALEEATVARVSVADLMLEPDGFESARSPSPGSVHDTQSAGDDQSSRKPLIVAAIVVGLTLLVLMWQQFGRQPVAPPPVAPPQPSPAPNEVVTPAPDALPAKAVDAAAPTVDAAPAPVVDAAAPADAAQAASRAVRITSDPDGAEVTLGDAAIGITPLDHTLPIGRHTVRLAKRGYVSKTVDLHVQAGDTPLEHDARLVRRRVRPPVERLPDAAPPAPDAAPPEPDAAPPVVDAAPPPKPEKPKIQVLGNPSPAVPAPPTPDDGDAPEREELKPLGTD